MNELTSSYPKFQKGTVYGFDLGTGSIGYAVRRASDFQQAGALLCSNDTSDLSGRRGLRRQRRTLAHRNDRRQWFRRELASILDVPEKGDLPHDPITLRCRALDGKPLAPLEILAALVHLFKRRGVAVVPWANDSSAEKQKEEGVVRQAVTQLEQEMAAANCEFPCQFLDLRRKEAGTSPTERWRRGRYWPRELLEKEFRAIVKAQKAAYPQLQEKADWLLFGETKKYEKGGKVFHVFHKATEGRNPGILGLRWARFDNRDPNLDILRPYDEQGRPQHVVRRNKDAFKDAQWPVAIFNFRVLDLATGAKVRPDEKSLVRLKEIYDSKHRKKKPDEVKVSVSVLRTWEKEYAEKYQLLEGQTDLKAASAEGRARFSSPTLRELARSTAPTGNFQPLLKRDGETQEEALNRYLRETRHPLVRHRLLLYANLLKQLVAKHGPPDFVVVEAARSLAEGKSARIERENRDRANQQERQMARENLNESGQSTSRQGLLRFRLWKETKGVCPFCLKPMPRAGLFTEVDIEHLVPRALVDCNEFYNLTVAHIRCNRERKRDMTPYQAFSRLPQWEHIESNARDCFKGRKLELFLSDKAEQLIEEKTDLQHTSYIARAARQVTLIVLDWLGEDGRDPVIEKQNPALRFQVTNGQLTSRLRDKWGLNELLHPKIPEAELDALTPEQREAAIEKRTQKNRGDLRHHALDAMVIASTLPWLAHRTHGATDENGNHGWWTQDEKQRSKAANPINLRPDTVRRVLENVEIRPHVSKSRHRQAYNTTLYARKGPDTYVAREVFTSLKTKDFDDIYPQELGLYCREAWMRYEEETSGLEAQLKARKGCLPEHFIQKLCFSHFQQWRAAEAPGFTWPKAVKIPIRSVRLISVKSDKAVMSASSGTHAYVKRTEFKEVRIHLSGDDKQYVPVFVPWWNKDSPFSDYAGPLKPEPVRVIQRGEVIETIRPFSSGRGPGKYRLLSAKQKQVELIPHHLANSKESLLAAGLPESGLQPYWPDFIRALGYELPHPSPHQPGPARPGEA